MVQQHVPDAASDDTAPDTSLATQYFSSRTVPDEPWLRLPDETPRQWRAFVAFRDLGPKRSLQYAADIVTENVSRVAAWSRRWEWTFRVQEFDRYVQRQSAIAVANDYSQMLQRQAGIALALQEKALARLKEIDPSELTPKDVLAYLKESTMIERTAREAMQAGQPLPEERQEEKKQEVSGAWMGDLVQILAEAGALPSGVTLDVVSEVIDATSTPVEQDEIVQDDD